MIKQLRHVVSKNFKGMRFDIVAAQLFPELSRKFIKNVIDEGGAYLNKRRVTLAKKVVMENDLIELMWQEGLSQKVQLDMEHILISNDDFLIINKPAGLPSQATLTSSRDSVIEALQQLLKTKNSFYLVHRLDKETSGLMIVAKNQKTQSYFENAFRNREITKTYHALCFGILKQSKGEIQYPIQKDNARKNAYIAKINVYKNNVTVAGQSAHTDYSVLQSFPQTQSSYVECYPRTGRTHQIRVHLLAIGYPILGDKTYASNVVSHPLAQLARRHMLHARELKFLAPNGESVSVVAPFPDDFLDCLKKMKGNN